MFGQNKGKDHSFNETMYGVPYVSAKKKGTKYLGKFMKKYMGSPSEAVGKATGIGVVGGPRKKGDGILGKLAGI